MISRVSHVDILIVNENQELVVEQKKLNDFHLDLSDTVTAYPLEALGLATIFIMKQYLLYRSDLKKSGL